MQTIYDAKILIVDDNQDLLNLVTTALRSTGYNQLTACTGCAAAQAAFAANRPDLMILDINLPDGDGFTLFRTLHSMAAMPSLQVPPKNTANEPDVIRYASGSRQRSLSGAVRMASRRACNSSGGIGFTHTLRDSSLTASMQRISVPRRRMRRVCVIT